MIGARTFIVRDSATRQRAAEFVGSLPYNGNPLEVTIRVYRDRRSLRQNKRYRAILALIADETGHAPDELDEVFKRMFLPSHIVNVGTSSYTVAASTSRMKVDDFGKYMDRIEAWAANEGLQLPMITGA